MQKIVEFSNASDTFDGIYYSLEALGGDRFAYTYYPTAGPRVRAGQIFARTGSVLVDFDRRSTVEGSLNLQVRGDSAKAGVEVELESDPAGSRLRIASLTPEADLGALSIRVEFSWAAEGAPGPQTFTVFHADEWTKLRRGETSPLHYAVSAFPLAG